MALNCWCFIVYTRAIKYFIIFRYPVYQPRLLQCQAVLKHMYVQSWCVQSSKLCDCSTKPPCAFRAIILPLDRIIKNGCGCSRCSLQAITTTFHCIRVNSWARNEHCCLVLWGKVLAGLERPLARTGLEGLEAVSTQNQKIQKSIVKTLFNAVQWNFLTNCFSKIILINKVILELFQQIMQRHQKKKWCWCCFMSNE